MIAAAFLMILQPVSTPAPPPPEERTILDAFRAACGRADDVEHMKEDALGTGWEAVPETANAQLEQLTRMGREMTGTGWRLSGATYRRTVSGHPLFLIVSRAENPDGVWGSGCRIYDFNAVQRIDSGLLDQWMGRTSTESSETLPGHFKLIWEPGWRDGVTVEVNHVPQDSPLREEFGLSGNVFVAQAIGGF